MNNAERIAQLRVRIEALATKPPEEPGRVERAVASLHRLFGWRATYRRERLEALLGLLRKEEPSASPVIDALYAALVEAGENLSQCEKASRIHRYVPSAHLSWLTRVVDTLGHIAHLNGGLGSSEQAADRELAKRLGANVDAGRLLAPLTLVIEKARVAIAEGASSAATATAPSPSPDHRVLELELAAIDHVIEAARGETEHIERRRRLLEAARKLLLDASAALPLEREGVVARERDLREQITWLDRLEAAGVEARVGVTHQVRRALRRGDRERLYATLVAMDSFALGRGDIELARACKAGLDRVDPEGRAGAVAPDVSFRRSAQDLFGKETLARLEQELKSARSRAERGGDAETRALALEYLAPGCTRALSAAMVSVDGCFEVGARLSPVRAQEIEELVRVVDQPTREMILVQARSPNDLGAAILEDPRRLLLDLAAGRLLSKKYIDRRDRVVERTRLAGEVRVYLLDGSSSMMDGCPGGARARMRDAILLAELATMMRRLDTPGRRLRLALFSRFFTKRLQPVVEVRSETQVLTAMADVVGTPRTGGTDIEAALLSSFSLIADAKRTDPDLARASIVLITDGEAEVDLQKIQAARERAADVVIGVSVIALGQENPALRALVARQRARGERAFYHYLDDPTLHALANGELAGRSLHFSLEAAPPLATEQIEAVLQEIDDLASARQSTKAEGARAHEEAISRDRLALERRFARWFPATLAGPLAPGPSEARVSDQLHADLQTVTVLLAAIAETIGDLGADPLHRRADAIDLLERMLPDARISPGRYFELLTTSPAFFAAPLVAVHRAAEGAAAHFDGKLQASRTAPLRARGRP